MLPHTGGQALGCFLEAHSSPRPGAEPAASARAAAYPPCVRASGNYSQHFVGASPWASDTASGPGVVPARWPTFFWLAV